MYENLTRFVKKLVPRKVFNFFQPAYHFALAILGSLLYRNPGRDIFVIGITGTKGKTTTVELVSAILEEAGYKTAIASTLRFKIGIETQRNLYKMTMPGRFVIQKFIREAVKASCDYAIIEMTSEGAKQYRHKFLNMNSLIFTNITPEHLESHGSYEAYLAAKLSIAKELERSSKPQKTIIVNVDSEESEKFLAIRGVQKITYRLEDAKPFDLSSDNSKITFEDREITTSLPGEFNVYNILAAASFARTQNIDVGVIKRAIERFKGVAGRMEETIIKDEDENIIPLPFKVIVDYAHTEDSLRKVYGVYTDKRKICVLGSCGGGRDKWKRPLMGKVADENCDEIILTNEDPYDEDPKLIILDVASGIKNKEPKVIIDRREAIREAISKAGFGDIVIVTGKGTDPYIMGPNGTKQPWSDLQVAEEELAKVYKK
ncbi:MAG: UDP-N-acetylmuramyl-tripeptide synthetase [Candidatus Vogelbacteria bacterium]|nr:UDP-N-acetylmuramyl-tripeptide synthetase [Candidatus Vogelbacteria bacterium]